jgi:predicted enzyme related to lactoylglutathione lyase
MTNREIALTILIACFAMSFVFVCLGQDKTTAAARAAKEEKVFQGLRTVIYHVEDLPKAKQWYAKALGVKPYFDESFYVGFNVGGFELGLDPDGKNAKKGGDAGVAYWGVSDARTAYVKLLEFGAKEYSAPQEVGDKIIVAKVTDPFGNVLGIIENPNFKIGKGE